MAGGIQDATEGTVTREQPGPVAGAAPRPEPRPGTVPATLCVPFEAHTRADPDAPAVLLADRQVSYAELNAMANRLANRLLEAGVGPERVVAVCAERSLETLAAILCVLKAGGTLLPLDPRDPQERLQALIADARPRVVLADPQNRARFATEETLWVDAVARSPEDSDPPGQAGPRTGACMFYTSGSTGSPKGVLAEHRGLLNLLTWTDRCLLGERELRLPVISRLALAPAFKQLFVPWLRGEPVWLLDERVASDPVELLRALSGDRGVARTACRIFGTRCSRPRRRGGRGCLTRSACCACRASRQRRHSSIGRSPRSVTSSCATFTVPRRWASPAWLASVPVTR